MEEPKLVFTTSQIKNINKAMTLFDQIDASEQEVLKQVIAKKYLAVYDQYAEAVSKDEELNALFQYNHDYDNVAGRNERTKYFPEVILPKNTEKISEVRVGFDAKLYQQCRDAYQNREERTAKINEKKKLLNHKLFVLGRKKRINRLNNELINLETQANHYAEFKSIEDKRNDYIQNRTSQYFFNQEAITERCRKHAIDIVYPLIKVDPTILCVQHTDNIMRSYDEIDCEPLNNVCNEFRDLFFERRIALLRANQTGTEKI